MKALFKHLSAITQGEPGSVVNRTLPPNRYIASHAVSTTLLAVLLGIPQVAIIGSGKAIAQAPFSCPAGTAPETVQLNPSDSLQNLTQEFDIGGIRTVFTFSEAVPGQVIDRIESRVDNGIYGGIQGPDLRLNIGPGKPPETGSLAPGNATLTITFAQPVQLASSATLLDVDRDGARDNGRTFQDVVTVTASNNNSNVPVALQSLGDFTRISGNTAFGIGGNSFPDQGRGNVSVTPGGAVDQIRIEYIPGTEFGPRGQDQTIGLAPFTICAPLAPGAIGDTVYRDTNGNGTQDPGEEGIGGVNLTLTSAGPDGDFGTPDDTTQTTTTDENGIYGFPNLPPGNYRVVVDNPPDGLTPTQTPPETIVVAAGENFDIADFGFSPQQATGSIGDTVYRDNNNNSVQDEGDTGIPGVTVTLINPGADGEFGTADDTTQTTTTNESGIYTFSNLPAGNYQVTSATPEGLNPTQTQPDTVNLQSGQNIDTVDFGFSPQQVGSIGDTVYIDTNRNNVQDPGELGREGVTVTLTNPGADGEFGTADDTTQTTITNENGNYTFPNLPAGNYRVTAESPGADFTATQVPPDTVELQPGQNLDTVDFGFVPGQLGSGQSSIGDTVYNDTNRNNTQDDGETGIPGATVTLTNAGGDGEFGTPDDTTQTTTTNENGNYSFPNLPAGTYRVTTTTPDGLTPTQTPPDPVNLGENQNLDTVDFGFAPVQEGTGSIGDTVYNDTNSNNTQDDGETGIPGVTVTLTGAGPDGNFGTDDDTTQTTTTDNNGIYGFTNLPPANYRVTTTTPNGLTPTQTQPDTINLQANQNIDTIDFGFAGQQGTSTIGDTVYNDTNRNNTQDDGETGIPGVTVTLRQPGPDGNLGTDDDTTQTTTTNENGNYSFPNLPAGNYSVTITNPDGLTPTQTPPDTVTLADNQNLDTVDFGLAPQQPGTGTGTLGDTVYNDINGNGQQDPGEPGIAGVIVNYAGTGPDGVFGESLNDDDTSGNTRTDANGNYTFPNLPAGTYRVTINDQSQQPIRGLSQTQTPNNPITLNAGDNIDTADFGFTQPTGTIGDTVYRDNNSSGTQEQGEPGIPGVQVTLTRPGADNQLGTGDDTTDNTTTDNNGRYSFTNVPLGNYTVTVNNPPDGLNPTQTPPNPVSLTTPGQNFDTADFGFSPEQVGTIGDFVFFDNDGDSTPDGDESGIPGITLILRDSNGNEIATTNTDENGFYNFVVPAGTYTVSIGNPPQGLNPTLTQPNPITLQAGENIDTVDFGFQPPVQGSIGDTVFADLDGDGTQDPGEPGVSGVEVRLIRPGDDGVFGTPDDQITEQNTDNTTDLAFNDNTPGQYTFDNLPPGNYQVEIALPDGSVLTTGANPISVDLQPNQNLDSADFGIRMTGFGGENPGSIGDEVFNDTNGNGVRDEGEPGIPNVPLTLTLPGPDGQLDTPDDTTRTTTTNDEGIYTFDELPPGTFRVSVTPPLGFTEVTNPSGSEIETNLQPGQSLTNVDFGLRAPEGGSIGDTVFNDTNGNGVQDFTDSNNNGVKDPNEEGEEGIPGVQLTLRDSDGDIVTTTTTNDNGNYVFNGLPLDNFTVEATRPTDFSPTTETTLSAQLTEANPNPTDVDFGFRPGLLGASGPINLRLVKRITNILRGGQPISGVAFNQFEDDPNDDNDNVLNSSPQSSPVGITGSDIDNIQSGDIVEYTIYFLSEGGESLQNVKFCDLVPDGTTFVGPIQVSGGGTGADDGTFLSPLTPVPTDFQNICNSSTPPQGAVITNLGTLPAGGQFGFVRFRVRVD
ncbi:MAG: SdrD B-like domain-containing protein [Cyanobacteria bacterium J06635_10]